MSCIGATDLDSGINAILNYTLLSEAPFRVDLKSGCIFVDSHKPLNFEKKSLYSFEIQVSDNGINSLTTKCYVEIRLIEVNKNTQPPQFKDIAMEASVEGKDFFTLKESFNNRGRNFINTKRRFFL